MFLLIALVLCLGILSGARILLWLEPAGHAHDPALSAGSFPLAVLGDSDSQSYQDSIWFPPGGVERGGKHRERTLQWTEVLARLRPQQLDLGAWGVWGSRSSAVRLMGWFGVRGRAPRKEDYCHNFAFAGARGEDLMRGNWRQAPRLAALMDAEPERWRRGIVVIRIGVVNFGGAGSLDQLARDPQAPPVRAAMQDCLDRIRDAIALIHARHPHTRMVLVGILDNSDYPGFLDRWRSRAELGNIRSGLDFYDCALRALAAADPRLAFFDDRAWFAGLWGTRDADGLPAYRAVAVGARLRVEHATGDEPENSVLADGHAGVVWNALWAQALVSLLSRAFDLQVPPLSEVELAHFLEQDLELAQWAGREM